MGILRSQRGWRWFQHSDFSHPSLWFLPEKTRVHPKQPYMTEIERTFFSHSLDRGLVCSGEVWDFPGIRIRQVEPKWYTVCLQVWSVQVSFWWRGKERMDWEELCVTVTQNMSLFEFLPALSPFSPHGEFLSLASFNWICLLHLQIFVCSCHSTCSRCPLFFSHFSLVLSNQKKASCQGPAPADPGYSKERQRRRRSGNNCLIKR